MYVPSTSESVLQEGLLRALQREAVLSGISSISKYTPYHTYLFPPVLEWKRLVAMRIRIRRMDGKHVHTRPTSISIIDHQTIGHWSPVGFEVEAYWRIDASRSMETIVALTKSQLESVK